MPRTNIRTKPALPASNPEYATKWGEDMIRIRSVLFVATFAIASATVLQGQTGRFTVRRDMGEVMRERARERREATAERAARATRMAEDRAEVRRARIRDWLPEFGAGLRQERTEAMRVRRAFEADRREMLREQQPIQRTPRPPRFERRIHRLSMGD